MKKCWKWFAALAAVGTVVGLVVAVLLKRKGKCEDLEDSMDLADDDFDLDVDLKPVSDREYVPLKKAAAPEETANNDEEAPVSETKEVSEEEAEKTAAEEETSEEAPVEAVAEEAPAEAAVEEAPAEAEAAAEEDADVPEEKDAE